METAVRELNMLNNLVIEMCEEFLMSESCSRYLALGSETNNEGQDLILYFDYIQHANLCMEASIHCKNYLRTKDINKLLLGLKKLGLRDSIKHITDSFNIKM
jgi:hypothetical protein